MIKLSICITTLNRAALIGATLESILPQLTDDCEVVVLDAASTDNTEGVMSDYARRFSRLRYIRQEKNNGFDRDCDRVVELSHGEYCWLMTDDDLLKPGAVDAVLRVVNGEFSLVILNMEVRSADMSKMLQPTCLTFDKNREYKPSEMDGLFSDLGDLLKYVGCVVISRRVWLAREKDRYFGSWFVFLGVIFQSPLPGKTLVVAEPLIRYRSSVTHSWSARVAEINLVSWPSLVESLPLSEAAKRKVGSVRPWRSVRWLLVLRGAGVYSLREYRRWLSPQPHSIRDRLGSILVALLPGLLVNVFFLLYYAARQDRGGQLQWMRDSRFYFRNWGRTSETL